MRSSLIWQRLLGRSMLPLVVRWGSCEATSTAALFSSAEPCPAVSDLVSFPQPFPRESGKLGFRLLKPRRGAGVVERGSLENCWRRKALVGSNPTPSVLSSVEASKGCSGTSSLWQGPLRGLAGARISAAVRSNRLVQNL
jgi:hypothetical protein